jgi:hypothetical protein
MFKHLIVTTFVAVALVVFALPTGLGTDAPVLAAGQSQHQHDSPPAAAQPRTEPMMCHQMMAEKRAADSKLEQLVNEMSTANGDAKVAAMAQIVTELVRQRAAMHNRMAAMDHGAMMNGRSGAMKK